MGASPLAAGPVARGASNSSTAVKTAKPLPKPAPPWKPLSVTSFVTSIYDSNINRVRVDTGSYGLVGGSSGRYQSSRSHPGLAATYTIAKHSYTTGNKWDRVSHDLNVVMSRSLTRRLTLETIGEIALKGSSEDRDISDQYIFLPRLGYRPRASQRARLYGAYRLRRYDVTTTFNAINRYAGVDFRQDVGLSGQWEAGFRFETNSAEDARRSYTRRTYSTQYASQLSARDQFVGGLKYRRQRYDNRLVKIDSMRVPRMDNRIEPSLSLVHRFSGRVWLELDYDYENRTSNDPKRGYRDHRFTVSSQLHW